MYNLATVFINGDSIAVLWKNPFSVDVTDALCEGENTIEIQVANLWVNKLIGDACKSKSYGIEYKKDNVITRWPAWVEKDSPPDNFTLSFSTWKQWNENQSLLPTGLLGPVYLQKYQSSILEN